MNRIYTYWLMACLSISNAQAAADITGSVAIENDGHIPAGTQARAILTIKNNGPDGLSSDFAGMGTSYAATVGFRTLGLFPTKETAPCTVNYMDFTLPPPGLSTIGVNIFANQPIPPGESVSCIVNLTTYPESPAFFIQRFSVGFLDDDPDPTNNIINVPIRTRMATTVAVPINGAEMLATIIFGIMAFGVLGVIRDAKCLR